MSEWVRWVRLWIGQLAWWRPRVNQEKLDAALRAYYSPEEVDRLLYSKRGQVE